MVDFNVVLFDGFETLDAFGPVEVVGRLGERYRLGYFSRMGGVVVSSQGVQVRTLPFLAMNPCGILLVVGGMGTRELVKDREFLGELAHFANQALFVLSVCTGSALLACAGVLDGRRATSNKRSFGWVRSLKSEVAWEARARWVVDGKFYSSSGVSAGMDMTLGFVADMHGVDAARGVARGIEYLWNEDKDFDSFFVEF